MLAPSRALHVLLSLDQPHLLPACGAALQLRQPVEDGILSAVSPVPGIPSRWITGKLFPVRATSSRGFPSASS